MEHLRSLEFDERGNLVEKYGDGRILKGKEIGEPKTLIAYTSKGERLEHKLHINIPEGKEELVNAYMGGKTHVISKGLIVQSVHYYSIED